MPPARTFTFLGTGTSVGVPMVGCACDVCTSSNPRNHRYRCAVLVTTPAGNLLIDTPPELRLQLLRARVRLLHAVLFTHAHADHLFGLDDVRPFQKVLAGPMPLYCGIETETKIREVFSYAFGGDREGGSTYVPKLEVRRIQGGESFSVLDQRILPIPLEHNRGFVFGFRIDDVAYCTDVSRIPDASWPLLEGVRVLILDTLRFKSHSAHFGINDALATIERLRPERAYLTHMSHELEHEATNRLLPPGVELAYDGLSFEF